MRRAALAAIISVGVLSVPLWPENVAAAAVERRAVLPPKAKPIGPYTPGILAGDFLYISGQGAPPSPGNANTVAAHTRVALESIREIVVAAGLTMDHLVYAQVYLADLTRIDDMNAVWAQYFPVNAPARSVVGVAHMPLDTRVEISAVAVRDLTKKHVVKVRGVSSRTTVSPAVYAAGRVYLSGVLGRDASTARLPDSLEEQVKLAAEHSAVILAGAGRRPGDLLTTVYITARMPVEIAERGLRKAGYKDYVLVPVTDIPLRSNIEITGVAARDLVMRSGRGETNAVLSGFGDLSNAVVSNVFIDSIRNFQSMNEAYKPFFGSIPPTRTTVQPFAEADHGEHAVSGERPRVQPLHKGFHGNLITILALK